MTEVKIKRDMVTNIDIVSYEKVLDVFMKSGPKIDIGNPREAMSFHEIMSIRPESYIGDILSIEDDNVTIRIINQKWDKFIVEAIGADTIRASMVFLHEKRQNGERHIKRILKFSIVALMKDSQIDVDSNYAVGMEEVEIIDTRREKDEVIIPGELLGVNKSQLVLPHTVGNKTYYNKDEVIEDLKTLQRVKVALYR